VPRSLFTEEALRAAPHPLSVASLSSLETENTPFCDEGHARQQTVPVRSSHMADKKGGIKRSPERETPGLQVPNCEQPETKTTDTHL